MKIYDISRSLSADLAAWPGDTPFHFELKWKIAGGASVNVGAISSSVHNGTHADAFYHFDERGAVIDRMPLDAYIGPAVVIDVATPIELRIDAFQSAAADIEATRRVLLKTNAWGDSSRFPDSIPTLGAEAIAWLAARGVRLLGVDVPSVDAIDSKDLPNHHALASAHIAIIESLDLSQVTGGVYFLAAAPVKIRDGDAAPVRAVLWQP